MCLARTATFLLTAIMALASISDAFSQTPKRGGVFRHAVEGEPANLDRHAAATSFALQVLAPHYSTLLSIIPQRLSEKPSVISPNPGPCRRTA